MITSNKKVLITGGSSGIGFAIAKKFLFQSNTVIIIGRDIEKLEKIKLIYPQIHIYKIDVTKDEEVQLLATDIQEKFNGIDVLINNAGVMQSLDVGNEGNDLSQQLEEIAINFSSPIRMLHYFLPQLKKSKEAVVINVSSGLAFVPFVRTPIYSATKAALHFWTKSIRLHLEPHGIQVLELIPPLVNTPLSQNVIQSFKPMSTEELAESFWKGYVKSREEIVPGKAKQLKLLGTLAPKFIFKLIN